MDRILIVTILAIFIISCAEDKGTDSSFSSINIGTDSTFDIITWNIQNFPKHNTTLNYLLELISIMDPDIIALQEIANSNSFSNLVNSLDGWSGYRSPYSNGWNLAYIYKNSTIEKINIYEIYTSESRPFSRPPLVLEFEYKSKQFILINNHLKCCGDGEINEGSIWEAALSAAKHRLSNLTVFIDYNKFQSYGTKY